MEGVDLFPGGFGGRGPTGPTGPTGPIGPTGPRGIFGGNGFSFTFSTDTDDSDPGNGKVKFNNATYGDVSEIYVDLQDSLGTDITDWVNSLADANNNPAAVLKLFSQVDPTRWAAFTLVSVTSAVGYRKLSVNYVASSDEFTTDDGDTNMVFAPAGNTGEIGPTGPTGPAGGPVGAAGDVIFLSASTVSTVDSGNFTYSAVTGLSVNKSARITGGLSSGGFIIGGQGGTNGGIWLATVTPSTVNYVLAASPTTTALSATSTVSVFIGGSTIVTIAATGATIAGGTTTPKIIGGTTTTSTLTLQPTSGAGTTGADIVFAGGTNGGTEFGRWLNNGKLGIGNSPTELLTIGVEAGTTGSSRKAIRLNSGGFAAPAAYNTASNGDKVILFDSAAATYDARIGVGTSSNVWFKSSGSTTTTGQFDFYCGSTPTNVLSMNSSVAYFTNVSTGFNTTTPGTFGGLTPNATVSTNVQAAHTSGTARFIANASDGAEIHLIKTGNAANDRIYYLSVQSGSLDLTQPADGYGSAQALMTWTKDGLCGVGSLSTPGAQLQVTAAASTVGLLVQLNATPSDSFQVKNSSNVTIDKFDSSGNLTVGGLSVSAIATPTKISLDGSYVNAVSPSNQQLKLELLPVSSTEKYGFTVSNSGAIWYHAGNSSISTNSYSHVFATAGTQRAAIDKYGYIATNLPEASPYTAPRMTLYNGPSDWGYLGYGVDAMMRATFGKTGNSRALLFGTTSATDNTGTFTELVRIAETSSHILVTAAASTTALALKLNATPGDALQVNSSSGSGGDLAKIASDGSITTAAKLNVGGTSVTTRAFNVRGDSYYQQSTTDYGFIGRTSVWENTGTDANFCIAAFTTSLKFYGGSSGNAALIVNGANIVTPKLVIQTGGGGAEQGWLVRSGVWEGNADANLALAATVPTIKLFVNNSVTPSVVVTASGTAIGGGVTSPGAQLQVTAAASTIGQIIKLNATPGDAIQVNSSSGSGGDLAKISSTGAIYSAANVGIGGATPSATAGVGLTMNNAGGAAGALVGMVFQTAGANRWAIGQFVTASACFQIYSYTAAALRLNIDANGNTSLGGATSTNNRLSVADASSSTTLAADNNQAPLEIRNTDITANNWGGIVFRSGANSSAAALISAQFKDHSSVTSDLVIATCNAGSFAEKFRISAAGNIVCGTAALATNATDGFPYIPSCAGTPSGTPTAFTGRVPEIVDSSANQVGFYLSAWKFAALRVGRGRSTAQVAAVATVATYTVGAADGTFEVSANVNVTTSTTHSFSVNVDYTDETNTARTLILPVAQLAGAFVAGGLITNVTGAGPYESSVIHIRCKAATTITISTSAGGTYTAVTYNVEGNISQTA